MLPAEETWATLVRHESDVPRQMSTDGPCRPLVSYQDDGRVAAWAHAVEIEQVGEHYHRRSAELYYVLAGEGQVTLDGQRHAVRQGSIVHIPPGVIHSLQGPMRVLVVGVPHIAEEDTYYLDE